MTAGNTLAYYDTATIMEKKVL